MYIPSSPQHTKAVMPPFNIIEVVACCMYNGAIRICTNQIHFYQKIKCLFLTLSLPYNLHLCHENSALPSVSRLQLNLNSLNRIGTKIFDANLKAIFWSRFWAKQCRGFTIFRAANCNQQVDHIDWFSLTWITNFIWKLF